MGVRMAKTFQLLNRQFITNILILLQIFEMEVYL